jgi:hypothetical protein
MFPLFVFVVLDEDERVHTLEWPFCTDATCPCHQDDDLLFTLALHEAYKLLTHDEALLVLAGKRSLFAEPQGSMPAAPSSDLVAPDRQRVQSCFERLRRAQPFEPDTCHPF